MHLKSLLKTNALVIITLLLSFSALAQAPNLLNYQGVARNAVGNPLPNQTMKLRLSIHDLLPSGAVVYSEIRQITTNLGGLFSVQIGSAGATSSTGTLGGVNWIVGNKFLQVELDPASNNNYIDIGTVQLVSVPYAFGAGSAATVKTNANLTGVVTSVGNATSIANGAISSDMIGTLNKSKVGLDLVNNTSDAAKPISTATQAALGNKLNIADSTNGYVTPTQLAAKTFDTTSLSNRINSKATISDLNASLNTKLNIADSTTKYITPTQLASYNFSSGGGGVTIDTTSLSNRINLKANTTDLTTLNNALTTEATTARAAELALANNIASNTASITSNTAAILAEVNRASAAELVLTNNVGSNTASITANTNNIVTLNTNLATNTATMNAIAANFATLNADVVSNTSITTSNTTAITGEVARATAAELALTTNVASNTASTSANTAAISAEVSRATAAELSLGNNITAQTSTINLKANASDVSNALALKANAADLTSGLALKLDASQKGIANGIASLNSFGIIPSSQLPPVTLSSTNVVASDADMIALSSATVGSIAIRTDVNKNYVLNALPSSTLANWVELLTPAAPVQAVNGYTGSVNLLKSDIGLGDVDNTSDANKPVSTATQSALDLKANTADLTSALAQKINTSDANAALALKLNTTDANALLAQKMNTTDANTALSLKLDANKVGTSNGVASLNALGKVPSDQIPAISFSSVKVLGSQAEMLALSSAVIGSVVVRTDVSKNYVLAQSNPAVLSNWVELLTPAAPVQSVNGYSGNVSITKSDISLGNVDNTTDLSKPVSTATQAALDLKANLASPTFTGIVTSNAINAGAISATSVLAPTYASTPKTLTYTGSTINWNPAQGLNAAITLTQNSTLSFTSAPPVGSNGTIVLTQDGTGNRTITLPTITGVTNRVLGSTSTSTIALSTAANAKDILDFYYEGGYCYWKIGQGYGTASSGGSGSSNLSSGVTGTLSVGNGGTGVTTLSGLVKGNGSSAMSAAAAGVDYVTPGATFYIGTTPITNNRSSQTQTLQGVSITGNAATATTATTASSAGYATTAGTANSATSATNALNLTGSFLGDVTGSQTATVIGANRVTNTMLAGGITVAKGGTGANTLTGLVKGNGTNAMTAAVAGTDYQAPITLTTTGTGAATLSGTTLNIPSITGGVSSLTYTTGTSYASGGTISGTSLTLAAADGTNPGLISTGAQTIAGAKTFTGAVTTPIYASTPQTLTDASTISWNPSLGLNASVTLGGDRTLSFSSTPAAGSYGTLVITQDATGGRNITLPSTANKILGSTSTTTIALSTAGGAKDILNFYYDGTNCFWSVGQGYGLTITNSSTNLATGVTGTLPVANGGTGATTLTGLVKGNGTSTMTAAVAGTDYQLPITLTTTGTGAATLSGTTLNIPTVVSTVDASSITGTVAVANGGTGLTTTPANGQIDIGNGTGFTRSTLTAGTGISITNATGTITIASSGSSGVPYTGATSAVNLGAYDLTVNGLTVGIGTLGTGTANTNTALGYYVMKGQNDLTIGSSSRNTALGSEAARYLTGGVYDNTAVGFSAMRGRFVSGYNQMWAYQNTGLGSYALSDCDGGSYNVGVGYKALQLTQNHNNVGIGWNSGLSNTTGYKNVFIGSNSGGSNTSGYLNVIIGADANVGNGNLTNAIAIGSGANVSSSNTIKLGNTSITSVTTSGALTTGAVTYPIAHGTANQILTTTGSGTLTWTTPSTTATSYSGTLPVANGGTGVTSSTGTGNVVLSASPTLTGTPIAPTATAGDNSTQIATTAFVTAAVASSSGGSGNITYTTGLNNDLGGYVIYVTPNGKHGLVVETYEFPSTLYLANDYLKDPTYHSVAGKNFMDWRVPTQYELDLMFTKKVVLGLSNSDVYWSSTNIPASPGDLGSYYCRYSGGGFPDPFESEHFIRAVRSF